MTKTSSGVDAADHSDDKEKKCDEVLLCTLLKRFSSSGQDLVSFSVTELSSGHFDHQKSEPFRGLLSLADKSRRTSVVRCSHSD